MPTHAPASAAAFDKLMVSLVLSPPTPATIGVDCNPSASKVSLMKRIRDTRSSKS